MIKLFKIKSFKPGIFDLLGVVSLISAFFYGKNFLYDPGAGWHLKSGMLMNEGVIAPRFQDLFSLDMENKVWLNDQWLADSLSAYLLGLGGLEGVKLITCFLFLLTFVIFPGYIFKKTSSNFYLSFFFVIFAKLSASIQFFFRPFLFGFFFLAILSFYLSEYYRLLIGKEPIVLPKKFLDLAIIRFLLIPLVFAFWVNCHPTFLLGLLILGLFSFLLLCFGRFSISLFLFFILSFFATLLNPFGFDLYLQIFELLGSTFFTNLNQEWKNLPFNLDSFCSIFIVAFFYLVAGLVIRFKNISLFNILLVGLLLFMSFKHMRYVPIFIACSMHMALELIRELPNFYKTNFRLISSIGSRICAYNSKATSSLYFLTFFVSLLFYFIVLSDPKSQSLELDSEAVSKIIPNLRSNCESESNNSKCRIFHSPNEGGVIIYYLWPQVRVYLDDRNQFYGEERYKEYINIRSLGDDWQKQFEKYNFNYVLEHPKQPIVQELSKLGWQKVIEEKELILLKK